MMHLLSLLSIALLASTHVATAAPLQKRASSTSCAATFTGMTIIDCHCTASCTLTGRCCDDYRDFALNTASFASSAKLAIADAKPAGADRLPEFHKVEVAVMGSSAGPTKDTTLLAVRNCVFEDVLRVPRPRPGEVGITVMPQWELRQCTSGYDVVAMKSSVDPTTGAMVSSMSTFKNAVKVPAKVRVAIGEMPPTDPITIQVHPKPWDVLYYAEVSGDSAEAAYKMALGSRAAAAGTSDGKLPAVFTARLVKEPKTGKLPWDPTKGRTWAVTDAKLSTVDVVTMAIPESDVSPRRLDENYDEVAKNANYRVTPTRAGHLRKIWDGKKWLDVVDARGNRIVPQLPL